MLYLRYFITIILLISSSALCIAKGCGSEGVWLQVLGSGGPELDDDRASSGYLIWQEGHAKILVDVGGGSLLRFEQSGASLNDLEVILISHFHVDHSVDLPVLIKASYFTNRSRDLLLYGPSGNNLMPSATEFVAGLFGSQGVYRYLDGFLDETESYRLLAHNVEVAGKAEQPVVNNENLKLIALPVHHGPIPALAWRVEIGGFLLVFSGDMNNDYETLTSLAKQADLLLAHHAIPEQADGAARNLHMPPSVIGIIAAQAGVKQLVLSHRMKRTLGQEQDSLEMIKQSYQGPVHFAEDLQCFRP